MGVAAVRADVASRERNRSGATWPLRYLGLFVKADTARPFRGSFEAIPEFAAGWIRVESGFFDGVFAESNGVGGRRQPGESASGFQAAGEAGLCSGTGQ